MNLKRGDYKLMKNYLELGKRILNKGHTEESRIGGTLALHNEVLNFNLEHGFPLMTTKHVGRKSIIIETLWYLKGTTSINYLKNNNVHVWDEFATNDDIGKTYSYQFRNFEGIDQVKDVIEILSSDYTSRRAIINLYNVRRLDEMSIPPCIATIQFNRYKINNTWYIDTSVYQRSGDFCLGVPYDIAEMALLTHIIAAYTDSKPGRLGFFYSNIHVYKAHIDTLKKQLEEEPGKLPQIELDIEAIKKTEPENLKEDMFKITNVKKGRKKFKYELF